ncbi:hypothetical protein [Kitasatospora sp. NBC_00315]|uniref:hypothetical protein n=1 Tax=Kitasatospora sp. NBC_00315 TaxID=2975963 RepID=UPI00325483A6
MSGPTAEQVQAAVTFIQQHARADRDKLLALDAPTNAPDAPTNTDTESARRIETALYTATTYLGGILLHQLTRAAAPDPRTIAACWDALAGTASQWVDRPDWPHFLPKPAWAQDEPRSP